MQGAHRDRARLRVVLVANVVDLGRAQLGRELAIVILVQLLEFLEPVADFSGAQGEGRKEQQR